MEYKDFVEQVKDQIQDFLPEKFADATISVHQVVKNNDCVLDGLTIRTEESNISPLMGRYNTREIIRESSPATNPVFSRGCEEFNNKI